MKAKLSKKNKAARTKDQYTVVLEELNSQFRTFGEDLSGFRREVSDRFNEVEKNQKATIEFLFKIDDRLNEIEKELKDIKAEIKRIDESKIGKNEFELLKKRVQKIEEELRLVSKCQKSYS